MACQDHEAEAPSSGRAETWQHRAERGQWRQTECRLHSQTLDFRCVPGHLLSAGREEKPHSHRKKKEGKKTQKNKTPNGTKTLLYL